MSSAPRSSPLRPSPPRPVSSRSWASRSSAPRSGLGERGGCLACGPAGIGALALRAFGAPAWLLPDSAAALIGIAAFGALLVGLRDRGLRQAWGYLRTLD